MKDYRVFLPADAAELCCQLWSTNHGNILNTFYFQYLCNRLRHSLVQSDIITHQELVDAQNDPNIYKPLFRAISQGLPQSLTKSRYGLGKVSDYDLWHRLQDKSDVEAWGGRLGLNPDAARVAKLARVQLRRDLKQLQERCLHGIYHSQLYPYYKLALLYVYGSWLLLHPLTDWQNNAQKFDHFCSVCLAVIVASWLSNLWILYQLHTKRIKLSVFTRHTSRTVCQDLPVLLLLLACVWGVIGKLM